jgi:hypothetical protein
MKLFAPIAAALAISGKALAVPYALEDLSFMRGEWIGAEGERRFSEYWTDGAAGTMAGVFKLASGDKLILVSQEERGPVPRFKHYPADYSAWEGPGAAAVEMVLSTAGPARAAFRPADPASNVHGLDYVLADGVLTATVTVRADDNPDASETFSFAYRPP